MAPNTRCRRAPTAGRSAPRRAPRPSPGPGPAARPRPPRPRGGCRPSVEPESEAGFVAFARAARRGRCHLRRPSATASAAGDYAGSAGTRPARRARGRSRSRQRPPVGSLEHPQVEHEDEGATSPPTAAAPGRPQQALPGAESGAATGEIGGTPAPDRGAARSRSNDREEAKPGVRREPGGRARRDLVAQRSPSRPPGENRVAESRFRQRAAARPEPRPIPSKLRRPNMTRAAQACIHTLDHPRGLGPPLGLLDDQPRSRQRAAIPERPSPTHVDPRGGSSARRRRSRAAVMSEGDSPPDGSTRAIAGRGRCRNVRGAFRRCRPRSIRERKSLIPDDDPHLPVEAGFPPRHGCSSDARGRASTPITLQPLRASWSSSSPARCDVDRGCSGTDAERLDQRRQLRPDGSSGRGAGGRGSGRRRRAGFDFLRRSSPGGLRPTLVASRRRAVRDRLEP